MSRSVFLLLSYKPNCFIQIQISFIKRPACNDTIHTISIGTQPTRT